MLRERTQRRLFRLLFVLGCVLPTLAVAGLSARRLSPGYQGAVLTQAAERFGVPITCERLRTPRPGVYELEGLVLGSVNAPLATCGRLTAANVGGVWRVHAGSVAIESSEAATSLLWRLADSGLQVTARADSIAIEAERLERLTARLTSGDGADRSIRLVTESGPTATLRSEAGAWRLAAKTGAEGVPADWLSTLPAPASVRAAGRFFGEIEADGRAGKATGAFQLSAFKAGGLMSSRGAFQECSLTWSDGRVESLEGRLTLRDGELTRSLVEGAAWWLTLRPFPRLEEQHATGAERFPFTQLACDVSLNDSGLTLIARNDQIDGHSRGGAVAHSIVEHGGTPVLGEPIEPVLPAGRLVQAWFSGEQAELPSSPAAIEMARRLPAGAAR